MHKKIEKILLVVILISIIYPIQTSHVALADDSVFRVNVKENLTVSITAPGTWASGDIGDFLRNTINVSVSSNSSNGFTAGMTTAKTDTDLLHSNGTNIIPTLTEDNISRSNFPANYWGYSLNDNNNTGTYSKLVNINSTPITIINSASNTGSSNVYFGTKSDITQTAGTYTGAIIISVVTDTSNLNPQTPTNNTPNSNTNNSPLAYSINSYSNDSLSLYTGTSSNTTNTTTNDNENSNDQLNYIPPQGETRKTSSNIQTGSPLATTLATTASIAAGSGILFLILAKRKEDEDEEENQ